MFVAASISACMTHEPARPVSPRDVEPVSLPWPKRDQSEAETFASRIPAVIPAFGPLIDPASSSEVATAPSITVSAKTAVGGAVLIDAEPSASVSAVHFWRVVTPDANWRPLFDPPQTYEANGKTFSEENPLYRRVRSSREYAAISSRFQERSLGTVVWFGGIGPSWKFEMECRAAFITAGFALIGAMESDLSRYARFRIRLADSPKDPDVWFGRLMASWREADSRHWTGIEFYPNAAAAGTALGSDLSTQVVETASSADPVLAWLESKQPVLTERPLIVVGCSGGVPAALAFASQHVDRLAGLIIVGGFEDFESLFFQTDLNDGESVVAWRTDTPLLEQQQDFTKAFAAKCLVDPGKLARAIPTDRVLMIEARFDSVVPTELSDRLWESLGRPERWKFFGGHRLLFWRLCAYGDDLAKWAADHARTPCIVR